MQNARILQQWSRHPLDVKQLPSYLHIADAAADEASVGVSLNR
jgi:hypothetical protein